jgi:hypothetical protein
MGGRRAVSRLSLFTSEKQLFGTHSIEGWVDCRAGPGALQSRKLEKKFIRCPAYSLVAIPTVIYFPYLTPEDVFVKEAEMKKNLIPQTKLKNIKQPSSKIY